MQAVVDIGSNSVKFTLGEVRRGVPLVKVRKSWVTRLGRDLSRTGRLHPESVAATDKALAEMAALLAQEPAGTPVHVVATSAVRDCQNPEAVADAVRARLGVNLNVISGAEEARLSLKGASASAVLSGRSTNQGLYIDVGGASTEVGVVAPHWAAHSFQAGGVRCHEGLGLDEMPVPDALWAEAKRRMVDYFPEAGWQTIEAQNDLKGRHIVAVGGSLLIAARLASAKTVSHPEAGFIGYEIDPKRLEAFNEDFRKKGMDERLRVPGIEVGRADILPAGLLCLLHVADRVKAPDVFITDWGLRIGLLFELTGH